MWGLLAIVEATGWKWNGVAILLILSIRYQSDFRWIDDRKGRRVVSVSCRES